MVHMPDNKISFNKFKRNEIIKSMFYKYNIIKLEINDRKKSWKISNI